MIPKRAIEKAIEGGWKRPFLFGLDDKANIDDLIDAHIALDPSFWQSLGKVLEWKHRTMYNTDVRSLSQHTLGHCTRYCIWRLNASHFYKLILMGGNTDAFWNELIPETK